MAKYVKYAFTEGLLLMLLSHKGAFLGFGGHCMISYEIIVSATVFGII